MERQPGQGSVAAADIYQFRPGDRPYDLIDDDGKIESRIAYTSVATDRFGATICVAEGQARTQFLREDDQGNIVLTAVIEQKDKAISLFEPPLVVAYRQMEAGVEQRSESAMRVVHLDDPSKVKQKGQARRTMIYAADQRLRTPLGEFVAKRIEVHFTADLKLAKADERATMFVVPEVGVVAEQTIEEVKVLGAFGRTTRRTVLLNR